VKILTWVFVFFHCNQYTFLFDDYFSGLVDDDPCDG